MVNPFPDQLLTAGRDNKKQLNKPNHEKRLKRQQSKKSSSTETIDKTRQKEPAHERRNRELNRQRTEENRKREQLAQVKQLVENNRLTLDDHGEPYYFAVGNRIKKLFISEKMRDQISCGHSAIVKFDDSYEVVTATAARQIASRDQETLVVFHDVLQ